MEKWSVEKANNWYAKLPWIRGCNFIGSDCANRLDMWQSYNADKKLITAERELAKAKELGFNTVRVWLNFDVWYAEKENYKEITERYMQLFDKYGQKVMFVLAYEEDLPRGDVFVPKSLGEQAYALGYHQGRFPLSKEELAKTPKHYMEYPELKEEFLNMVTYFVTRYKDDSRVLCWNVYNEPSITLGDERCLPLLKELFSLTRSLNPVQPLCADIWLDLKEDGTPKRKSEQLALELSDVISFHFYYSFDRFLPQYEMLKKYNRPIFVTEWLHRIYHNSVFDYYPFFYKEKIANYCWGFVVGKTQTNEPWDYIWDEYAKGNMPDVDFTKWQHDLLRPNLRPYDPHEIDLIKKYNFM